MAGYNDKLDADEQVSAEEEIAAYLFDESPGFTGNEEDAQIAARRILLMTLTRFRSDLIA